MKIDRFEHLTRFELKAYAENSLAPREHQQLGKHLLVCAECRANLAPPTPERLRAAILREEIWDEDLVETSAESAKVVRWSFIDIFRHLRTLGLVSAALVLLLGLSVIVWLQFMTPGNNSLVGGLKNIENNQSPPVGSNNSSENRNENVSSVNSKASESNGNTNTANNKPEGQTPAATNRDGRGKAGKPSGNDASKNNIPANRAAGRQNNLIVLPIRSTKCPPGTIDMILSPYFETVTESRPVLRWKKVPGAVSFHLYVSDSDQNLVEEAETKETSFKLTTDLEQNKSYRWKIVATLANDKLVKSESISFSVGKTAQKYSPQRITKLNVNPTRCIQ